jgi:hypothetical protein
MQQVWPDAFVEEGSIANNVSTPDNNSYITVLLPHF